MIRLVLVILDFFILRLLKNIERWFTSLHSQITSRKASKPYMKMVDNSYLGSSDEVSFELDPN